MKCVHTFGTGRRKRQADITLLFEYIFKMVANLKYKFCIFLLIVKKVSMSCYNLQLNVLVIINLRECLLSAVL